MLGKGGVLVDPPAETDRLDFFVIAATFLQKHRRRLARNTLQYLQYFNINQLRHPP